MSDQDPTVFPVWFGDDLDHEQHKVHTEFGILDFVGQAIREDVARFREAEDWAELPEEVRAFREALQKQEKHIVSVKDETTVRNADPRMYEAQTAPQMLADRNVDRRGLLIQNLHASSSLFVSFGNAAVSPTQGITVVIPAMGYYEMPRPIYTGRVFGVWNSVADPGCGVTELGD